MKMQRCLHMSQSMAHVTGHMFLKKQVVHNSTTTSWENSSDVKSHWNTKLRTETRIDPVTHKPRTFSNTWYGNLGGLRKSDTRTSSLNKDLKNAIVLKSESYPSPPQGFPNINSQVMPSTTSPQTAATQDTFLNNYETNNHHFDLLDELQAIKLVKEASNSSNNITFPPPIFVEESLSSSSSSSPTCSTAAQEKSTLDLILHNFLLDDAFLLADLLEQEIMADHSSKESASQKHNVIPQNETNKEAAIQECLEAKAIDCAVLSDYFQPPSSLTYLLWMPC